MTPASHRWLAVLMACSLFGCASIKPASEAASPPEINAQHLSSLRDITIFSAQGRIGVQTEGRGFSGSMQWQHDAASDQVSLYSPLGSQVASIERTANLVTLKDSNGKQYTASSAEKLTEENLGWSLPMRGMSDWVLGRPTSGKIESSAWDNQGKLTRLKQDGWDIAYEQYSEIAGHQLPGKVTLRSPKVNLKLIIEHWQTQP